ncbi:hypothetical protein HK104_008714 [Borealophlyctis nickersoniae]|nr:hypothetical protein HK104_008714 [Borealophlyctis nickersoniae]
MDFQWVDVGIVAAIAYNAPLHVNAAPYPHVTGPMATPTPTQGSMPPSGTSGSGTNTPSVGVPGGPTVPVGGNGSGGTGGSGGSSGGGTTNGGGSGSGSGGSGGGGGTAVIPGVNGSGGSCTIGSSTSTTCFPPNQGTTPNNAPCTIGTPGCTPLTNIGPNGASCTTPAPPNCVPLFQGVTPNGSSCTPGTPNCTPAQGISSNGGAVCLIGSPGCIPSVQGVNPNGGICTLGTSPNCAAGQGTVGGVIVGGSGSGGSNGGSNGGTTTGQPGSGTGTGTGGSGGAGAGAGGGAGSGTGGQGGTNNNGAVCLIGTPNCSPVNQGINPTTGAPCTLGSASCVAAPGITNGGAQCVLGTPGCTAAPGITPTGGPCTVGSAGCTPVQGFGPNGSPCTLGTPNCSAVGGVVGAPNGAPNSGTSGNGATGGNGGTGNEGNGKFVRTFSLPRRNLKRKASPLNIIAFLTVLAQSASGDSSSTNGLWWKILIPIAGIALLCGLFIFALRRRRKRNAHEARPSGSQPEMIATGPGTGPAGGSSSSITGGYGKPAGAAVGGAAYGSNDGVAPGQTGAGGAPVTGGAYGGTQERGVGAPAGGNRTLAPAVEAPGLGKIHKFNFTEDDIANVPTAGSAAAAGPSTGSGGISPGVGAVAAGATGAALLGAAAAGRKKDDKKNNVPVTGGPTYESREIAGPSGAAGASNAGPSTGGPTVGGGKSGSVAPVVAGAALGSAPPPYGSHTDSVGSGYTTSSGQPTGSAPIAGGPVSTGTSSTTVPATGGPTKVDAYPGVTNTASGVPSSSADVSAPSGSPTSGHGINAGAVAGGLAGGALLGAALAGKDKKDDKKHANTSTVVGGIPQGSAAEVPATKETTGYAGGPNAPGGLSGSTDTTAPTAGGPTTSSSTPFVAPVLGGKSPSSGQDTAIPAGPAGSSNTVDRTLYGPNDVPVTAGGDKISSVTGGGPVPGGVLEGTQPTTGGGVGKVEHGGSGPSLGEVRIFEGIPLSFDALLNCMYLFIELQVAGLAGAAVLVPGLGYLTYEQWRKHHNKPATEESRREFLSQAQTTQNGAPISSSQTSQQSGGAPIVSSDSTAPSHNVAGKVVPAVAGAGAGYLTYEQWCKHHNKPATEETRREFLSQTQPGQTGSTEYITSPTTTSQTTVNGGQPQYTNGTTGHHLGDVNGESVAGAVLIPGLGYLTYKEWLKHHKKTDTPESRKEFKSGVKLGYENEPDYISKFGGLRPTKAVLVPGLGYLTYEEWRKHLKRPDTEDSRREFDSLVRPGFENEPEYISKFGRHPTSSSSSRHSLPMAVFVPGAGYLTFEEWCKHHNKPVNDSSRREFNAMVQPGYETDSEYLSKFGNLRHVEPAVYVAGAGFLGYEEWRKHLKKPATDASRREFDGLVQPGFESHPEYISKFGRTGHHGTTTNMMRMILVPGVGYLTYKEWCKHHNKPQNGDTQREFDMLFEKPGAGLTPIDGRISVPGVGSLTYAEWLKHHGLRATDENRNLFEMLVIMEAKSTGTRDSTIVEAVHVPGVGFLTYEEWLAHFNKPATDDTRREFVKQLRPGYDTHPEYIKRFGAPWYHSIDEEVNGAVLVGGVGYLKYRDWLLHSRRTDSPQNRREFLGLVQPGWDEQPEYLERYGQPDIFEDVDGAVLTDDAGWLVYDDWLEHSGKADSKETRKEFHSLVPGGWDQHPEFIAKYGRHYRHHHVYKDIDGAVFVPDAGWLRYENWLDHYNKTHSDATRREFESLVTPGWEDQPEVVAKYGTNPRKHISSIISDEVTGAVFIDGVGYLTFWDWLEHTGKPFNNDSRHEFKSLVQPGWENQPEYLAKYGASHRRLAVFVEGIGFLTYDEWLKHFKKTNSLETRREFESQVQPGYETHPDYVARFGPPEEVVEEEPEAKSGGLFGRIAAIGSAIESAIESAVTGNHKDAAAEEKKEEVPPPSAASQTSGSPSSVKSGISRIPRPSTTTPALEPVILSGGGARMTRHEQGRRSGTSWTHQVPSFDALEEDDVPDLSAYHPPAPTSHVVVTAYTPVRQDEMPMQVGDLVGIEREYTDGWARGQNITHGRRRGLFPITILTPIKSGPSQTVAKVGGKHWLGWQERKTAAADQGSVRGIPARNVSLVRRRSQRSIRSNRSGGDRRSIQSNSSDNGSPTSLTPIPEVKITDEPVKAVTAPPAAEQKVGLLDEKKESRIAEDGSKVDVTTTTTREADGRVVTKVVTVTTTQHPDGRITKKTNTKTTTTKPAPAKAS